MAADNDKRKELVFLSLGSNLGDRMKNLNLAREFIHTKIGEVKLQSSIYKTEAWGEGKLNWFYNQVIAVNTLYDAPEVLKLCLKIESTLGREKKDKLGYENRVIDIDVLLFGNQIINSASLILPHPSLHLRNFVLVPFAEIASEVQHPVLKASIEKLKNNCTDHNKIQRME